MSSGKKPCREFRALPGQLHYGSAYAALPAASLRRKQSTMAEIINLGSLQLRFLQSKDDTAGSLDMFEMTLQPNARMPIPHYHESWDETIYGLTGTTTWRIDGKDIDLAPGETVFIKRGIVHGFTNRISAPATCLCTLSPGVIGPQYFRDMAGLLTGGAPDPAKMKQTMLRYGLIPAP
jgi:quercetin dioxygenase-like cupin family protein